MEKPNIVCIDDQRQVLATLQKDLEVMEEHCLIHTCETASEAKDLLNDLYNDGEQIALLICDHIMPGKNGVDFLVDVHEDSRFPHIKKILLTGLASHQDTITAINEAHVDHYLEKPWNPNELIDTVKSLVAKFVSDANLEGTAQTSHS